MGDRPGDSLEADPELPEQEESPEEELPWEEEPEEELPWEEEPEEELPWEEEPGEEEEPGNPEDNPQPLPPGYITVTFLDGDEVLGTAGTRPGILPPDIPAEDAQGNPILGWIVNGRKVRDIPPEELTEDVSLPVWHAPALTEEHGPYGKGKGEASFGASDSLTRAEATALIYNLLEDQTPGDLPGEFTDVPEDSWYHQAVSTMASLGVVTGYEDGTFLPEARISRGTFIFLLTSLFPLEETEENPFSDLPETHWARNDILSAVARGWLSGMPDGTVHPDATISRAEAVTLLNGVLGRRPSGDTGERLKADGVCIFTDVRPSDWYYADVMEACLPHTPGSQEGPETWGTYEKISCGYPAGVDLIRGTYYVVSEEGQIVFQEPGFRTIGGKLYFVDGDGSIPPLYQGLIEFRGSLYCVNTDNSLKTDESVGYLYFGPDGRYTSGNATVDAEVEKAMALCITQGMTREEKLHAAYNYVRNNCRYLSRPHHPRGSTDWYADGAITMFQTHKGNCYCYTGAFLYMARRLGYQAYGISGGYRKDNTDHAWVMIDGYIYDPCLDYLYPARGGRHYDLYRVDPNNAPLIYFFP